MDTNQSSSGENLLALLKNGDPRAFTQLYNIYSKKLFLVAFTATRSKETAKEIVQEVFASLWTNRQTVEIRSSVEAYLVTAARYKVYDHFHKYVIRERYKTSLSAERPVLCNTTEETLAFDELSSLVAQQIEQLPETTRKVFISSRFNGATIPEIAKESSLSIKAVEYHLTKALKHLRLRLSRYQPGPTEVLILFVSLLLEK